MYSIVLVFFYVFSWGDQPTLELVRQLVETSGFCFLDKDKRGDIKVIEDLQVLYPY